MIKLETQRLCIRDPKLSDFDDWHRLLSNAQTMYYLDDIKTHNKEESRQNLLTAVGEADNPTRTKYFLAMEVRDTGAFVGSVGYTVRLDTPQGKVAELGYFILPEFHGKGYTTEAVRAVLRFAFEENGVERIETGCFAENLASERIMQKVGMIQEGFLAKFDWLDGQLRDRILYRLLRDEWRALNDN